jgi:hypothetical protein
MHPCISSDRRENTPPKHQADYRLSDFKHTIKKSFLPQPKIISRNKHHYVKMKILSLPVSSGHKKEIICG